MVSNVCFVPEEKLGIAILTNNDNQGFFEDLRHQILDAYMGVPYANRSKKDLPTFIEMTKTASVEMQNWKSRVMKNQKPELPLYEYTGDYTNELYGKIHVSQEKNHLQIQFAIKPDLQASLEYMDGGEWLLTYNNVLYGQFQTRFELVNGKVSTLTTKENPFVEYDPYVFTKSK